MLKNEEAVSPVIGSILTVAITVILAVVIGVYVFGYGAPPLLERPLTTKITAASNSDTPEADIKIIHKSGDLLVGGGWRLSVVPVDAAQEFITASSSSEFQVGDQLTVANTTIGANWLDNRTLNGGGKLVKGKSYNVKLIQFPSQVLLVDTVIEVR
ncbi:MAG: type IV pilin N-terminal domain-containing protein [Candidatus Methanoperedens sp.]|nr:type IV pilin N-terminal domain-containing protein [Candidatus Methanoperedens sp.]